MNRQEFDKALAKGIRVFRCIRDIKGSGPVAEGELVELKYDDGSYDPAFFYPNKEQREYDSTDNWTYILLSHLEPYKSIDNNNKQYQDWADFLAGEVSCFHELVGHEDYVEQLCATILNIGEYLGGDYEELAKNLELELRKYDEEVCKPEEAIPEYKVGEILRVTYDYANWFNIGDIVKVTAIEEKGYIALDRHKAFKLGNGKWEYSSSMCREGMTMKDKIIMAIILLLLLVDWDITLRNFGL